MVVIIEIRFANGIRILGSHLYNGHSVTGLFLPAIQTVPLFECPVFRSPHKNVYICMKIAKIGILVIDKNMSLVSPVFYTEVKVINVI